MSKTRKWRGNTAGNEYVNAEIALIGNKPEHKPFLVIVIEGPIVLTTYVGGEHTLRSIAKAINESLGVK